MAGDKIVREDVTETELFRIPTKFIESHRFFSAKKFRSAATGEKKNSGPLILFETDRKTKQNDFRRFSPVAKIVT